MVRVKKQIVRSDTTPKAVKPKTKQRNERYLKYQRYIRSKQFKEVRSIVFERDNYRCVCCNRGKEDGAILTCHHRVYRNLFKGGEIEAADCVCLCQYCHKGLHSVKANYNWFSMDNPRNNEVNNEEKPDNNEISNDN